MKLIILHSVLQFPDHSDYTAALIESSPFFIAEVKRLLPVPRAATGSKSYMRIQFYGDGNKSFTSV